MSLVLAGRHNTSESLLHHGDAKFSRSVEEKTTRKAAGAVGDWRIHVVEQPLVGLDLTVKPHAVVQAGPHKCPVVPSNVVWSQDGVKETHVTRVGHDASVKKLVVSEGSVGLNPHLLGGFTRSGWTPGEFADETLIDGVLALEPLVDVLTIARRFDALEQRRDCFGLLNIRCGDLMVEAVFFGVEAGLHVVDGSAVLNRHNPAGGEALPVSNPVYFVENWHLGVTGPKKVRVERVHPTLVDRASGSHQGLGGDLASKDPLAFFIGLGAAEDIYLDRFEVEQMDKKIERFRHGYIVGETAIR